MRRRYGNRAPYGGCDLRQQFQSRDLHTTPAIDQCGNPLAAGRYGKYRNPGIGRVRQQFHQRSGQLARSRRRDYGILRCRGGGQGRRVAKRYIDALVVRTAVGHLKENGAACQSRRGIPQGGAKLTGIRRDAQPADGLIELLRLFPPRVVTRALEKDFEFGGEFSDTVFENLTRARRHFYLYFSRRG